MHPPTTLSRVSSKVQRAKIFDIKDVTHLDRLKIPIFSCSRLRGSGLRIPHFGKGLLKPQAEASVLMEAFERFSAEFRAIDAKRTVVNTYNEISNALNPHELILPITCPYTEEAKLRWVECWDLLNEKTVYIPANAIYYPYNAEGEIPLLKPNTNGLASGNTYEEAIFHGLMEVVERDAWSLVEYRKEVKPDIDLESLSGEPISILLKAYAAAGIELVLKDITSDIGIPSVAAVSEDAIRKDPASMTIGFGSHLNPEIAIIRAVLEVSQSRMVQLHGLRKDADLKVEIARRMGYRRFKHLNRHWFTRSRAPVKIDNMQRLDTEDILEDIHVALEILRSKGFKNAAVADLMRRAVCIPVVRVVVPGLEASVIEPERVGNRLDYTYRQRKC